MTNTKQYQYTYIPGAATTQIFTGQGVLHSIVIGTTAAGTIIAYDETGSGTTTIISTLKSSIVENSYIYDVTCSKGLKIIIAAGSLITVCWSQG